MKNIKLTGVRTHNLKNIDITIPRDKMIVITGLSGSGKSSLAFDTIFAEGQRRFVESLSAYARQFLSVMEKPDIDSVEGLSPAISIEQKTQSHNPRSTVGTITEIYDYMRLLYARAGDALCPTHKTLLDAMSVSQMVDRVLEFDKNDKLMLLAPIVQDRKGEYIGLLDDLKKQGFIRARIDGFVYELDNPPQLKSTLKHTIEVVIDRFKPRDDIKQRLAESFETALNLADSMAAITWIDDKEKGTIYFSGKYACPTCGYSIAKLEPKMFSFNNPAGACAICDGLGIKQFFDEKKIIVDENLSLNEGAVKGWSSQNAYYYQMMKSLANYYGFSTETAFKKIKDEYKKIILYGSGNQKINFEYISDKGFYKRSHVFEGIIPNLSRRYKETQSNAIREDMTKYMSQQLCQDCNGGRLNLSSSNVFIDDTNLPKITSMAIEKSYQFFKNLELAGKKGEIARPIKQEILQRLNFLINVGLDYLTLDRGSSSLSGGESQRIRLASQIGAGLVGVMYVLDEPSIGLHQRDNQRLLATLNNLKNLGNTIIIVEHDEEAILNADRVIDIGPGAGIHGGEIIFEGTPKKLLQDKKSLTGAYLSNRRRIEVPTKRKKPLKQKIIIKKACGNNLKNIDVEIPLGVICCITGVSGSGKSTLINDTLYKYLCNVLHRSIVSYAPVKQIDGLSNIDKVIDISQSPIGRTSRSNPATYTGVFTHIRDLFSNTEQARIRGFKPGRFSFNVKGGRCEACQGDGLIKVAMHFLPDISVVCDKCQAKRYNRETLDIKFKDKNIYEVLQMSVEEATDFFVNIPTIYQKLNTLMEVGLSYITLGQNATTLSGGEAQRIKLAKELSKRDTGRTLYILDEPTTGLHFHDIKQLLKVITTLRDKGNSIVIIEHNMDVIKTCDWIIDLGPEGGDKGGEVIATGTPEQVTKNKKSYTGQFLKEILGTKN
ncbi:MAG: excinuclease ABC subunit UvrA [Gammaproteobacteria bacterium]|nr:MAG: excinuclease ABC subunit UvrA [Gammaproteobacteria bacterium]